MVKKTKFGNQQNTLRRLFYMKTTLMLMRTFLGKGEQIKVDVNLFCFVKKNTSSKWKHWFDDNISRQGWIKRRWWASGVSGRGTGQIHLSSSFHHHYLIPILSCNGIILMVSSSSSSSWGSIFNHQIRSRPIIQVHTLA